MANRRISEEEQVDQAQQEQQATQEKPAPQASPYTKKDDKGNDIPWYPAPAGHATSHNQAIAARGQDMFNKGTRGEDPGIPDALAFISPADQKFVPMPSGGVMQLAEDLFPGDVRNQDAMQQHVFDLMLLNRDRLRTDTDYVVGQQVRIK